MNNEKMGRFISELRKSQQMTQKGLAQILNVTDKAVSKWERGLSCPDISLLTPLASILRVTVGELLNGEKNNGAEIKTEANTTVDSVLLYADEAVKLKARSARKRAILMALGGTILLWGLAFLSIIMWPTIARRWNATAQQRRVQEQHAEIALLGQDEIDAHFRRAEEHNAALRELDIRDRLYHGSSLWEDYYSILNVDGIMGRIEIPIISVDLHIFHGTGDRALNRGAGHLGGSDFPIGGYGSHSIIMANSGMRHARLFSDLESVNIGDYFYITVLDRRMTYRVESVKTILPNEIEALQAEPEADAVTLMTRVPYRVNSHMLLVRGIRVP